MNAIIRLTGYRDENPHRLSTIQFEKFIGPGNEDQINDWLHRNGFTQTHAGIFERRKEGQLCVKTQRGAGNFIANNLSNVTAEVLRANRFDQVVLYP